MLRSRFPVGLLLLGSLWAQGAAAVWAEDHIAKPSVEPSPAQTEPRRTAAAAARSPDAHALGIAERLLNYCSGADATAAARLREKVKRLAPDASEEALAAIRSSDEYRKAYDAVGEFVAKIDEHNAKRICSESLARGR